MGDIFLANSGKRSFQMFWYECPITKKKKKKTS